MATVTKVLLNGSNGSDGIVDTNEGTLDVTYNPSYHGVEFALSTYSGVYEYESARKLVNTWEDWGVPIDQIVTGIQFNSAVLYLSIDGGILPIDDMFVDFILQPTSSVIKNKNIPTDTSDLGYQSVSSGSLIPLSLASNSDARMEIFVGINSTDGGNIPISLVVSDISFTITYSSGLKKNRMFLTT